MTSLSTVLAVAGAGDAIYWLALQQEKESQLATTAEAAKVIDALFALDPCKEPVTDAKEAAEQQDKEEQLQAAREAFWQTLADEEKESFCADAGGCFTAMVRVYRSHQDKPYRLLVQGGAVIRTTVGHIDRRRQVMPVQSSSSLTLDLPGDQDIFTVWLGPCYTRVGGRIDQTPPIRISGNQLSWDGNLTGTIQVSYDLPYELVEIRTTGADCTVTGLYHLAVDEIILAAPPEDDQSKDLCQKIAARRSQLVHSDSKCYREVRSIQRCSCSGNSAAGDYVTREELGCPEGVTPGTVVERTEEIHYVNCGEVDNVHDPQYYKNICCYPPDFPLPGCVERHSTFSGKGLPQQIADELKAKYGPRLNLIGLGPKEEPCGKLVTRQHVYQHNCCEDVLPMTPHPDNPAHISPGKIFDIQVLDGNPVTPWVWTSSAALTFINGTHQILSGRGVKVLADTKLCAVNSVRVDDGCGTLTIQFNNDVEPLSISYEEDIDAADYLMGMIIVEISGGAGPYTLTTDGGNTAWGDAEGPQTILVGSDGLVPLWVGPNQVCLGDFNITVFDSCLESANALVDVGSLATGTLKICYGAGTAALVDWSANGCSPGLLPAARWITFSGFAEQSLVISNAECLPVGSYYVVMGGITSQAAKITVGEKYDRFGYLVYPIIYRSLVGATLLSPPPCGDLLCS